MGASATQRVQVRTTKINMINQCFVILDSKSELATVARRFGRTESNCKKARSWLQPQSSNSFATRRVESNAVAFHRLSPRTASSGPSAEAQIPRKQPCRRGCTDGPRPGVSDLRAPCLRTIDVRRRAYRFCSRLNYHEGLIQAGHFQNGERPAAEASSLR